MNLLWCINDAFLIKPGWNPETYSIWCSFWCMTLLVGTKLQSKIPSNWFTSGILTNLRSTSFQFSEIRKKPRMDRKDKSFSKSIWSRWERKTWRTEINSKNREKLWLKLSLQLAMTDITDSNDCLFNLCLIFWLI